MDARIFTHIYENELKKHKIEHLDCEFLRNFAKSMYDLGYHNGVILNDLDDII